MRRIGILYNVIDSKETILPSLNDLKNLSVLYADDDDILRVSTANTLQTLFQDVYTAKDGAEAISVYESAKNIHIVMLDIKMGSISGLDVAKHIRAKDKHTQIFLVSSYTEVEDMLEAFELNVVNYIQKPFTFKKLKDTLISCLENMDNSNQLSIKLEDGIEYLPYKKELILKNNIITLSYSEIIILDYLIQHRGHMIGYSILADVLGSNTTEVALKNVISRLHKKIGKNIIKNIPKIGYTIS